MSTSIPDASELSGGLRIFSGESEDRKEYWRWKLWISNKLVTLDKLPQEAYGSYLFTCLSGKALETVEHLEPSAFQKTGGEEILLDLLDKKFPEKEKSDELTSSWRWEFTCLDLSEHWTVSEIWKEDRCELPGRSPWMDNTEMEWIEWWTTGRCQGPSLRMKLETISQAMRSVYPDFVVKRKSGVAAVEDVSESVMDDFPGDEVQGFEDIGQFLADHVSPDSEAADLFDESDVAEVLATTWKEKCTEIAKLQHQRRFSDARDLKKSYRVEIEEPKKKSKCNR